MQIYVQKIGHKYNNDIVDTDPQYRTEPIYKSASASKGETCFFVVVFGGVFCSKM